MVFAHPPEGNGHDSRFQGVIERRRKNTAIRRDRPSGSLWIPDAESKNAFCTIHPILLDLKIVMSGKQELEADLCRSAHRLLAHLALVHIPGALIEVAVGCEGGDHRQQSSCAGFCMRVLKTWSASCSPVRTPALINLLWPVTSCVRELSSLLCVP